jgi:adenylyltransferase/sulfurtransferase
MTADGSLERYSRQMRFAGVGEAGQRRLLGSHVTLCGCGALGTVLANALVRGGVGHLRLIDRDFIETNNLQRQVLFDEHDVAENLPKAEAAARKLNASIRPCTSSRSSRTSTAPTSSRSWKMPT